MFTLVSQALGFSLLPMTQLLTDVGQMAFESIGFHAALILNRLRNEKQINSSNEQEREPDKNDRQEIGRELSVRVVNKKRGSS